MQWSFSNKASALPRLLSFKATQDDDGPRSTGFDSLTSAGFMTISGAKSFDSNHKLYSSVMQKKLTLNKQVGTHYTVTTYPPQQFAHQSIFASAGQNVVSSAINPQLLGGVPLISSIPIVPRSTTSTVGTTDLRNASKPSGGPAQLTIFYAGSVCVYNDVSPGKAGAIMLLAGNGNSATVETPVPRACGGDGFVGNQSNVVTTLGHVSATPIPSAVPQARKASLARFLEKRKERVMSSFPYVRKQYPEISPSPVSDSRSFTPPGSDSRSFAPSDPMAGASL